MPREDVIVLLGQPIKQQVFGTTEVLTFQPDWSLINASDYNPIGIEDGKVSGLGLTYADECTVFNISYSMSPRQLANGTTESDKTLLLSLQLRTLGQANLRQKYGPQTQDGVVTQ